MENEITNPQYNLAFLNGCQIACIIAAVFLFAWLAYVRYSVWHRLKFKQKFAQREHVEATWLSVAGIVACIALLILLENLKTYAI